MRTADEILKSTLDYKIAIVNNPEYTFNRVLDAMQQYAEEYHRAELLKLNKSDVISSVCNHRFVRTTKNYKPAKKCVECGYVLQTDL